jgi:hypothetical protein
MLPVPSAVSSIMFPRLKNRNRRPSAVAMWPGSNNPNTPMLVGLLQGPAGLSAEITTLSNDGSPVSFDFVPRMLTWAPVRPRCSGSRLPGSLNLVWM